MVASVLAPRAGERARASAEDMVVVLELVKNVEGGRAIERSEIASTKAVLEGNGAREGRTRSRLVGEWGSLTAQFRPYMSHQDSDSN